MKKFFKFVIAAVAVCAGVVGGLYLYSKIKDKKDELEDDFDDDYDDDFADDDDLSGYVKVEPAAKSEEASETAAEEE